MADFDPKTSIVKYSRVGCHLDVVWEKVPHYGKDLELHSEEGGVLTLFHAKDDDRVVGVLIPNIPELIEDAQRRHEEYLKKSPEIFDGSLADYIRTHECGDWRGGAAYFGGGVDWLFAYWENGCPLTRQIDPFCCVEYDMDINQAIGVKIYGIHLLMGLPNPFVDKSDTPIV